MSPAELIASQTEARQTKAGAQAAPYGSYFEYAPTPAFVLTGLGQIVEVNRAGAALMGRTRRQLRKTAFEPRVVAEDIGIWNRNIAGLTNRKNSLDFEIKMQRDDGTRVSVRVNGMRLRKAGIISSILVVLTEITSYPQTRQAIADQEDYLQLLATSFPDYVAVLDREGRRLYNSATYQRLFGDTEAMRGQDSFADIHEEDRTRVLDLFKETIRTGTGQACEYRFVLPDGTVRLMESVGMALKDSKSAARVVVVARDITERRHAEQKKKIGVLDLAPNVGMFVTDATYTVIQANPALAAMTGFSLDEMIGQPSRLLADGRHDEAFYAVLRDTLAREGRWQGELWNRRKNGEDYLQWLSVIAIDGGAGGDGPRYVATLTDISERKATEEQIRHLDVFDNQTQLPNRRLLTDRLARTLEAGERNAKPGALLWIGIDTLKAVNDDHGHAHGNLLLQQAAHRLKKYIRGSDTAARLESDQFAVIIGELRAGAAEAGAMAVAQKVRDAIEDRYALLDMECPVTASIGISIFENGHQEVDALMAQAKEALRQARQEGGNRCLLSQTDSVA